MKTPHLKLNKFLIYVALPAMILLETPKIAFSTNSMIPVYISWSVMIMSALLVYFASKRYQFTREVTGALMLVTVLTNSTFVGIPVITAYFGVEALPFIVLPVQYKKKMRNRKNTFHTLQLQEQLDKYLK